MLTKFLTVSLKSLTFLEKAKAIYDSWLSMFSLLLLGIGYFFIENHPDITLGFGFMALILIIPCLILGAYLFLRMRFFLWKKDKKAGHIVNHTDEFQGSHFYCNFKRITYEKVQIC